MEVQGRTWTCCLFAFSILPWHWYVYILVLLVKTCVYSEFNCFVPRQKSGRNDWRSRTCNVLRSREFRFIYSCNFHLIMLLHSQNTLDTVLDSKLNSVVLQSWIRLSALLTCQPFYTCHLPTLGTVIKGNSDFSTVSKWLPCWLGCCSV